MVYYKQKSVHPLVFPSKVWNSKRLARSDHVFLFFSSPARRSLPRHPHKKNEPGVHFLARARHARKINTSSAGKRLACRCRLTHGAGVRSRRGEAAVARRVIPEQRCNLSFASRLTARPVPNFRDIGRRFLSRTRRLRDLAMTRSWSAFERKAGLMALALCFFIGRGPRR